MVLTTLSHFELLNTMFQTGEFGFRSQEFDFRRGRCIIGS